MGAWIGKVELQNTAGGNPGAWEVSAPLTYCTDAGAVLTVLSGFITDGASIPRPAWKWFGPPIGDAVTAASILHDALYATQGANGLFSRADCDVLFRQAMRDCAMPWWQSYAMWLAVRLAGRLAWELAALNDVLDWEGVLCVSWEKAGP